MICRTCLHREENGIKLPISPPADRALLWRPRDDAAGEGLDTEPLPNTEHLESISQASRRESRTAARASDVRDDELCDIVLNDNTRLRGRLHRSACGKLVIYEEPSSTSPLHARPAARASSERSPQLAQRPSVAREATSSAKLHPRASAKKAALPSRRALPARAMSAAENSALALPAHGARRSSPLLVAALVLLVIVTPAFIISLYNMIENSSIADQLRAERNRAQMELDRERQKPKLILDSDGAGFKPMPEIGYDEQGVAGDSPGSEAKQSATEKGAKPISSAPIPLSDAAQRDLRSMDASLARPMLERDALGSEDLGTRLLALRDIARQRATSASAAVMHLLKSPHDAERQLAASVLGELAWYPARADLESLAQMDPAHGVRMAAARSLAKLGGDITTVQLAEFTRDELERLQINLRAAGHDAESESMRMIERELQKRSANGDD